MTTKIRVYHFGSDAKEIVDGLHTFEGDELPNFSELYSSLRVLYPRCSFVEFSVHD